MVEGILLVAGTANSRSDMPLGLSRVVLGVLLLTAVLSAQAPSRTNGASELSIAELLDRYRSGAFDAAVKELSTVGDPMTLQAAYIAAADAWIARDSTDITSRRLVATAFAIEVAQARLAYDNPTLIILLDWARKEWRKGPPSPVERVWIHAAVALVERGGRVGARRAQGRDRMAEILRSTGRIPWGLAFIDDAIRRFPDDARLRLANVIWLRLDGVKLRFALNPLTEHPEIGPEALVGLAFVEFADGDVEAARRLAEQAADKAAEPWTRYLAHLIAGFVGERQGRHQDAVREYAAALKAVPHAQSASIPLALLLLRDNQADAAFNLIDRSLTERPDGDDPWRLFAYGGYVRWPVLIGDVRKAIR
jgi:tetratricopeptide (TPR) repeat protein